MSNEGVDFLDQWVKNNVTGNDTGEARAAISTAQCVLQANERGLHFGHLEIEEEELERLIGEVAAHLAKQKKPRE